MDFNIVSFNSLQNSILVLQLSHYWVSECLFQSLKHFDVTLVLFDNFFHLLGNMLF